MTPPTDHESIHDIGKDFRPRVLLVDNIKGDVEQIREQLDAHDFEVVPAQSRAGAISMLATQIYDVALVDINLKDPDDKNNRDGLVVAEHIAEHAPETRVIFISRPRFLDADTLLKMFNRNVDTGRRLAEAYVDKADTEKVIRMVRLVVDGLNAPEIRAKVLAEPASWANIERDLRDKVSVGRLGNGDLIEAERQSVQILRRLAERELMRLSEVRLDRVGQGRSRTVVVRMTATYRPTNNDVPSVVKIGDRKIVDEERLNYVRWVPSFVGVVSYPEMTGFAASRQLAGIGYSMLRDSPRDPARTFVDRYWQLSEAQSLGVLAEVFLQMLVPRYAPQKAEKGRTLRAAYVTRFGRLGGASLDRELDLSAEQSGIHAGASAWTIPMGSSSIKVMKPTDIFDSEFLNPFWMSVAHGDLHGENVIVTGQAAQCRPFLIDFAHIGEHHVFLDYVVMEVSVRFHLLGALFGDVELGEVEGLLKRWMELERWLQSADVPSGTPEPAIISSTTDKLARLARLVLWLRRHARLHGFADSYYNYYGGVGMATLVAPFLPTFAPAPVRRAVRQALFGCAAFCLHRVKDNLKSSTPVTPLSEALESSATTDTFTTDVVKANLRIGQNAKAAFNAFVAKGDRGAGESAEELARPILYELQATLPQLGDQIARMTESFERAQQPAAQAAAQLFLFSSLMRELGSHGPAADLHRRTEDWMKVVWDAKRSERRGAEPTGRP